MQAIDHINTRRILGEIRKLVSEVLYEEQLGEGKLPDDYVKITMESILQTFVHKGILVSASVDDIYLKHLPWSALYLNKWERIRARFAHEVLRLGPEREGKPNFLLRTLGFKEDVRHFFDRQLFESELYDLPVDDIRSYIVDLVDEHLTAGNIRTEIQSKLLVPHEVKVCDISILPAESMPRIKISTSWDLG